MIFPAYSIKGVCLGFRGAESIDFAPSAPTSQVRLSARGTVIY